MRWLRHWAKGVVCLGVRRRPAEDGGVGAPAARRPSRGAGFDLDFILIRVLHGACFCRIVPATCVDNVPLETVADRSVPLACGPNVDHGQCLG